MQEHQNGRFGPEPLALDLAKTHRTFGDLRATLEDVRAWWALQADPLPTRVTATDLTAARAVREHITRTRDHVRRGGKPVAACLDALNRGAACGADDPRAGWAVAAVRRRDGSPVQRLASCLAEAAAGPLADPEITKRRECGTHTGVMFFLPAHPPAPSLVLGHRCGNRLRVARHYQRQKGSAG
ncbi:ABATE domain-containing protein [Streptomyces chartreusis]|uniref:ABATE domain-containing protein n=1 Tax=Streptomyces chartreusis TaxID=1969 RepID=UPI001C3F88A9|nr:ABATE domain-containing protein [Streptomyces chartreusis]